jgi:hypothetical protein
VFWTRRLEGLALTATVTLFACGDDEPAGPEPVTFPDWPVPATTAICVRGTALVGDTRSGTISETDCDAAEINPTDPGYFETWRVRVATAGDVTFDVSSAFDNFLTVLRVNSITSTGGNATVIGDNDDRSASDRNALVTVRLEPNVDYVVAISSLDYLDFGLYTLTIR